MADRENFLSVIGNSNVDNRSNNGVRKMAQQIETGKEIREENAIKCVMVKIHNENY